MAAHRAKRKSRLRRMTRKAKIKMRKAWLKTKLKAKKAWRKTKKGAKKSKHAVGHAGHETKKATIKAAKATGRGTKKAAIVVGRGTTWAASGVLRLAIGAVELITTGALIVVSGVLLVVGTAALAVATVIGAGMFGLRKYLVGPLRYAHLRLSGKRKGQSLRNYLRTEHGRLWADRIKPMWASVRETPDGKHVKVVERVKVKTDDTVTPLFKQVVVDPASDLDQLEADAAEFDARAQQVLDNDVMEGEENFPGARTVDIASQSDPYDPELGNDYTAEPWYPTGEVLTHLYNYANEPQLDLVRLLDDYRYYRDSNQGSIQWFSYWEGRIRMLARYLDNPDYLDKHGHAWARDYQEIRFRQNQFNLKAVRLGYTDEVTNLERIRAKAAVPVTTE